MTSFLDTSTLICLVNSNEQFHNWSVAQLQRCKTLGPAIISDIVYCEFSVGMATQNDVDAVISQFGLQRLRASDAALFRAGKAFKLHLSRGGSRLNVLPDFIIGWCDRGSSSGSLDHNQSQRFCQIFSPAAGDKPTLKPRTISALDISKTGAGNALLARRLRRFGP